MGIDSNQESLLIWKELQPHIANLIAEKTKDCIRWKPAIVITADAVTKTATVREVFGPSDGSSDYAGIPNITGYDLNAGDSVFIQYAYSATNAIVAFKNQ